MPGMRTRALLVVLSLLAWGCSTSRALVAIRDGRIAIKATADQVVAAAGEPDLILATRRVETFYYQRDDLAVSVTMVGGVVVAFNDSDKWHAAIAEAADDASDPVSLGAIRVGMSEQQVRAVLDEPDGVTAKDGQETLHWLTGDDVDSVVHLRDGKVVGFWDRPVSEYTQNLPTSDRDNSTTSGRLRVGMTPAQAERLIGKPEGVSANKGLLTHRYESDPVFGDNIIYSVDYRDGKVVNLYEFNVTRDEDEKEAAEARSEAAVAEAQQQETESFFSSILSNPAVQAALGEAAGGSTHVKSTSESTKATRTLNINGKQYQGGPDLGKPCSLDEPCPGGYTCHLVTKTSGMCVQ